MKHNIITIDRYKVLLILEWYKAKFGKSLFCNKKITIRVYRTNGYSIENKNGVRGTYLNGKINIFLGSIYSVKELCETIGHEYKHYLMDIKEYDKIEKDMLKTHDYGFVYMNHPHEIKCSKFERKWGNLCFNQLRYKLYK